MASPVGPDAGFENQGGVADSNPNPIKRWLSSVFMRRQSSLDQRRKSRKSAEKARQKKNETHQIGLNRIEYKTNILTHVFLTDPHFNYEEHVPVCPTSSRIHHTDSESIQDKQRHVTRKELIAHATKLKKTIPNHQLYPKPASPIAFLFNLFEDCKK